MKSFDNSWLQQALACKAENELEAWVHRFLQGAGDNHPLSDGLKLIPRFWIGPVCLPLKMMKRCCGPEPEMPYQIPLKNWEVDMKEKTESWQAGWQVPPLLLRPEQTFWSGLRASPTPSPKSLPSLTISDGNHRHEMLLRAGEEKYWAIIWVDSKQEQMLIHQRLKNLNVPFS